MKPHGRELSVANMSVEKRLTMRPKGVVSKKLEVVQKGDEEGKGNQIPIVSSPEYMLHSNKNHGRNKFTSWGAA
jgi:hypothetical protein